MTKSDSLIMKGVAILLMLFLHLFNQLSNVELCQIYLFIGEKPFINLLTRCANPVPFFLILSGYGFYKLYSTVGKKGNIIRILKLYIHYWISLFIFIPIGAYMFGVNRYPGNIISIINNVTGWYTTYNGEIWFLFPNILLVLVSFLIFKFVNKVNWLLVFSLSGTIYFFSYLSIHLYGYYLFTHMLPYMPILFLSLQFSFILGMLIAKYVDIEKLKIYFKNKSVLGYGLLVLLIIIRLLIETDIFHVIYAVLFIVLFSSISHSKITNSILSELGRRSTSIWFVHTYFCYYYFHDFIYSFKFPILIYIVLLALSYISALIIDSIYKWIITNMKLR